MTPSNPPNSTERSLERPAATAPEPRPGAPFPDAPPKAVSALALGRLDRHQEIARRAGARAEVETLRAQLRNARQRSDADVEAAVSARLARCLVARGSGWGEAIGLARRSLVLGEDPQLREELSGWFASLGRFKLAAVTLEPLLERPLAAGRRAAVAQRVAVLAARAGEPRRAAVALQWAARAEPQVALAPEMVAVLHEWAPDEIGERVAARALLEASRRHAARDATERAFDCALRAFIKDPTYLTAAQELAERFAAQGKRELADEVWRQCLLASPNPHPQSEEVTWRRVTEALRLEAPRLALGAALDAQLDRQLDPEALWDAASWLDGVETQGVQPTFDGLLVATQSAGWLAARLRLQAALAPSEARWWQALARCYSEGLNDAPRAGEAWGEALLRDPDEPAAARALWTWVQSHPRSDPSPLVWALRRAARQGPQGWRQRALEQLIRLAERRVVRPVVGVWAAEQLQRIVPLPSSMQAVVEALRRQCESSATAPSEPVGEMSDAALRAWRERSIDDPGACEVALEVLGELSRRQPAELRWYLEQARLLKELGRLEALEMLWRQALEHGAPKAPVLEALVDLHFERGAPKAALALLEEEQAEGAPWLLSLRVALASSTGTRKQRSDALAAFAEAQNSEQRSLLWAIAASEYLALGKRALAQRCAQRACRADPESLRAIVEMAEARRGDGDRLARVALAEASERSWPRPAWCRAVLASTDASWDAARRQRWLRRWLALEPGNGEASRALLSHLRESADADEILAAMDWLIGLPRPLRELSEPLLAVADRLAALDPARCRGLVERLLSWSDLEQPGIVERFAELADRLEEPGLHVARLERLCALNPAAAERSGWLLQLTAWHARRGDGDAGVEALWRALHAGADATTVLERLTSLPPRTGSDAQLREAELRVELTRRTAPEGAAELARVYRELGAALWDLAGDRERATLAFVQGAERNPEAGDATLVRDLIAFFGYPDSISTLLELAEKREQPRESARLLLEAARAAHADGFEEAATQLAYAVLRYDPSSTEALWVVEECSTDADAELLEECYARVDEAALGCFGVRALHYRAARQFGARRQWERAFRHAQLAFEAAPSEGRLLTLLSELAQRTGSVEVAVAGLLRVARAARTEKERQRWLQRVEGFEALAPLPEPPAPESFEAAPASGQLAPTSSGPRTVTPSGAPSSAPSARERIEGALARLRSGETEVLLIAEELQALLAAATRVTPTSDAAAQVALCARVFSELRQVYVREGASEHLERLLTAALEAPWLGLAQRAEAARELAELLDRRGAHLAALDVLSLLEGWGSLQLRDVRRCISIARAAGEGPRELDYLRHLERATDEVGERRATLRRMAELQRGEGRREGARESLFALLEIAPGDPSALEMLMEEAEREAQPAPWWATLEAHVSQRKGPADIARRLARLYLQQEHQVPQARSLLQQVLEQHPADVESWETLAEVATAERDWVAGGQSYWRAARQCRQARRASQLAAKAAQAFLEAGDLAAAQEVLTHRGSYPETAQLAELCVELWRRREDDAALGDALERWSELAVGSVSERVGPLIEAASVALRIGDWERALDRARRAARLAPTDARAQLLAKSLEYRQRGPGTREEALRTVSELRGVRGEEAELVELKAFLLAEALDQRGTPGLGLRELRDAQARVGARPLIALGLAERLASEDGNRALGFYEAALRGDLKSLREPSAVAREAAQLAERYELSEPAQRFWEQFRELVADFETAASRAPDAQQRETESASSAPPNAAVQLAIRTQGVAARPLGGATRLGVGPALAPPPFDSAPRAAGGVKAPPSREPDGVGTPSGPPPEATPVLPELDVSPFEAARRALEAVSAPPDPPRSAPDESGRRLSSPPPKPRVKRPPSGAPPAPSEHAGVSAPAAAALDERKGRPERSGARFTLELDDAPFSADEESGMEAALRRVAEQAAALSGRPAEAPSVEPSPAAPGAIADADAATAPGVEPSGNLEPETPRHRGSLPPGSDPETLARRFAAATRRERQLLEDLCAGELAAGEQLLELLDAEGGRQRDVVEVLRIMVSLAVGEPRLLERLRLAAQRDNDTAYAAALLHAAEALNAGRAQCMPPPLEPQPVQADVVLNLLQVGTEPALEALGLLWQHAPPLFRENVEPASDRSPLPDDHRLWTVIFPISRLLGASRLRLWIHEASSPRVDVILDQPPGLMLSPDLDWDSTAVQFELGQALLETRPELLLVRRLPEARLQALLTAVLAAFGPPRRLQGDVASIAELAERFWELLPPRVQRRLGELCEQPDAFEYAHVQAAARAARRRGGLFVSGDLAVALREVAREETVDLDAARQRGEVAELCRQHRAFADLVRLATSSEYAEARWRLERLVTTDRQP